MVWILVEWILLSDYWWCGYWRVDIAEWLLVVWILVEWILLSDY